MGIHQIAKGVSILKGKIILILLLLLIISSGLLYVSCKQLNMRSGSEGPARTASLSDMLESDTMILDKIDYYEHTSESSDVPTDLQIFVDTAYVEGDGAYLPDWSNSKPDCRKYTSKIDLTLIDLDNNGSDEYVLLPWEICGVSMRGASGNGDILIMTNVEDQYKIIGLISAANGFTVLSEESHGYKNIMVNSHSSAATGSESIYSYQTFYNGEEIPGQYEIMLTKYYDLSR